MPVSFTFVLGSEAVDLPEVFARAELALFARGFWRKREVIVSGGDPAINEHTVIIGSITRDMERLRNWTSIYMEFSCATFCGLGVQIDVYPPGYSTCFVHLNHKVMLHLHKQGIPTEFYTAVAIIAEAAKAVGGFGEDMMEAMDPVSPDRVLANLLIDPLNRDVWEDAFVLHKARLTSTSVEVAWEPFFTRVETGEFVFFVNNEFLLFCREFG